MLLTMIPAPRWPILGVTLFSMIRTGMPFVSKVRANISPDGPAPIYIYAIRWVGYGQSNDAQLKLGRVQLEDATISQSLLIDGTQLGLKRQ